MGVNDPIRVKLTDTELAERAQIMAAKLAHIETLRKKKTNDAKSTQALIDDDLDTLQKIARVVLDAEEERRQGELTFDQMEAAKALHDIAAVAGDVGAPPAEPAPEQPPAEPAPPVDAPPDPLAPEPAA